MNIRHGVRFLLTAGICCSLQLGCPAFSWAEQITHTYDASNRLIRTEYGNGSAIEYSYDAAGNIISKQLSLTPAACTGDCNGNTQVTVNEIIVLVNIALGSAEPTACAAGIPSGSQVNVALIIQAVNHALNGCTGG
jgi:YD repeat-containing protein